MKVTGFTFIRNAIRFDYPIVEAIRSILPICTDFVVAVGNSDDQTLQLIQSINDPKIRIINTIWDDTLREGGKVLAIETDKAIAAINQDADWCFYIQGDEVVHEDYLDAIYKGMQDHLANTKVEGLLFDYKHFYGSYDFIADSRQWYRAEVRIIRNVQGMSSYKDAQGFRLDDRKLRVKKIPASIYHYGWVKHPKVQQEKRLNFNKLWHSDDWVAQKIEQVEEFDYTGIDSVMRFEGTHPEVMDDRILKTNWTFSFDPSQRQLSLKEKMSRIFEKLFKKRLGEYQNYELL